MIDITKEHFNDKVIDSIIEGITPKNHKFFNNIKRWRGRNFLKNFRIYEIDSVQELMDKYDFLNQKKRLGWIDRRILSGKNNDSAYGMNMEEILLYNQCARPERKSYHKNLTQGVLEGIYVDIDTDSFIKKDSFELCELQLMDAPESDEYIPATFIYKDNIYASEKDMLKNQALMEIILGSNDLGKYDMNVQTMDEDYEIDKGGITLLRGRRLLIKDLNIHDDEGYKVPDYEPLLVSVFK